MTILADLLICLRFFSRLPVPETERERRLGAGGLAAAAAMTPFAGLVLAALQVAMLALASALALPRYIVALSAVAAAVVLAGALHEDALADCVDGFGGGRTRERKLAIMRDSRIGAYGTVALVLSLMMRIMALAAALDAHRGVIALLVAAVLSRSAALVPLALLPPARVDGAGAAATLSSRRVRTALILAGLLVLAATAVSGTGIVRAIVAVTAALASALAMTALASRQIGGQTGDVAGATQQLAEMAVLLVFASGAA